jgi:LmbE family N-acetylglucosaminyl deacetylase
MAETLKLMAIFPHPDDETLGLGPTLEKHSAEGEERDSPA